ncbi:hypothetical protein AB3S75_047819 [Citrus x aurantiifolia]
MARTSSSVLLLLVLYITCTAILASRHSTVKPSCKSTTYPTVCVQYLLPYASKIQRSPKKMSLVALSVSLSRTKSAYSFLTKLKRFKNLKPRESRAIADCLELMDDSVDRLSKSFQEMKNLGRVKSRDFLFHMSNVQTWASAALTNGNTCLDGFADKSMNGKVKDSVTAQVANVVQVTSNALGLVNQFANNNRH